ncbi:Phage protein [Alloactinosynnema sp. L-07]|uniref:phage tail fiber protein n=1 Tax=Alloactinosynnema sp. L-07 TaxID=1653480 RepID=UPI00065F047F|nr:hypothetical protein [Alloactinosynnema sp. L-07]CRK59090.1 Phage protein [Alloactinosynnema sp. L-07]
MGFTDTAKQTALDAVAAAAAWITLHTADPGTTGASEVAGGAYTREQTTWAAFAGGSRVGSQVTFDVPAGVTITHWGIRTAASGGTFYYGGTLSASETFGAAGQYLFTPTLTATG